MWENKNEMQCVTSLEPQPSFCHSTQEDHYGEYSLISPDRSEHFEGGQVKSTFSFSTFLYSRAQLRAKNNCTEECPSNSDVTILVFFDMPSTPPSVLTNGLQKMR